MKFLYTLIMAYVLTLMLYGCGLLGTDIGAPDYGAREVPKQPPGMSDDEYWKMLTREGWF